MNSRLAPVIGRAGGTLWLYLGRWLAAKKLNSLAETCYTHATAGDGKVALEAGFLLSQQLLTRNRYRQAASACVRILRKDPRHARAWCALGASLRHLAKMAPARRAYENAVSVDPRYAQAWCNLGEWQLAKGHAEDALKNFDRALHLEAGLVEAKNNRIAALYELGRFKDAEAAAESAIKQHPHEAALHVNMGNVLFHTGKARLAIKAFRKALECDDSCAEAHMNLATMLGDTNHYPQALAYIKHEIAAKGESAQRLASLAHAQKIKGDILAAEMTCRKVLKLQPDSVSALITLAGCLSTRADQRGSIKLYRQALAANPQMPGIFSNIAFDATYLPDISSEELYDYHRQWAQHFELPEVSGIFPHEQSREPERPLRIGYVSGDFGHHPVGFLLRDVVRFHDREKFYIHCYSMMRQSDHITNVIRQNADSWIDALLLSDEELADQIHQDRIDILVDLSGHTAYNRLPAFIRRPAPIQATWIGYFHSTGLESIDYFITDPYTSPPGCDQRFSEVPVYLPHSRFCYSPPDYAPDVSPPPVLAHPHQTVTFGCFNRLEKLVDPVIAAWSEIISQTGNCRLLIKAGGLENEDTQEGLRRRFRAHGMDDSLLHLRGPSSHPDMLEQYSEVDIALDPFPFNGGMTTLEALWMGVPVLTVSGVHVVARQTISALSNIGLAEELAFPDVEAYVRGAVSLARNLKRLEALRASIRDRVAASPIRDAKSFSRDVETLYRQMWLAWCKGTKMPSAVRPHPAAH